MIVLVYLLIKSQVSFVINSESVSASGTESEPEPFFLFVLFNLNLCFWCGENTGSV